MGGTGRWVISRSSGRPARSRSSQSWRAGAGGGGGAGGSGGGYGGRGSLVPGALGACRTRSLPRRPACPQPPASCPAAPAPALPPAGWRRRAAAHARGASRPPPWTGWRPAARCGSTPRQTQPCTCGRAGVEPGVVGVGVVGVTGKAAGPGTGQAPGAQSPAGARMPRVPGTHGGHGRSHSGAHELNRCGFLE